MFKKLLSLLSDALTYGASSILGQIIGFLLLPLYTRHLEVVDQWVIAMLVIVSQVFLPLANLGMTAAIFRRFSLEKSLEERACSLVTAMTSVSCAALFWAAVGCLAAGSISWAIVGDASIAGLVRLTMISAAANAIGAVPLASLRADRRVKTASLINLAKLLLTIALTILLVVVYEWRAAGVVVAGLVAELVLLLVQFGLTARAFRALPRWAAWRRLASYGVPFLPHHLQSLLMVVFAQYWVGRALSEYDGGLYATAIKITTPVSFIVTSVQSAWVAFKFQIHAEDDDPAGFFRAVVTYYVAAIAYLWVGVCFWGPEVVWLMTPPDYHAAAWLIPGVGLIPVAQGLYFMLGTGMELTDNTRKMPLVSLSGLITSIILSLTLVQPLGATGAAIATSAAWMAMTIAIYRISRQCFRIDYDWPALTGFAMLAAAGAGLGYLSQSWTPVPRIGTAIAVSLLFPAIEFLVLCRSSTERHRMQALLSRLRPASVTT